MNCNVYRSEKKPETYLYLPDSTQFQDLPEELQHAFGEPFLVVRVRLSAERPLARVDVLAVMDSLESRGYFLQLPAGMPTEEEITRWLS